MVDVEDILSTIEIPHPSKISSEKAKDVYASDLREIVERRWEHYLYSSRIQCILDCVEKHLQPGSTILDMGCAQRNVTLALAELGYVVEGLDLETQFIQYAKLKQERGTDKQKTLASFHLHDATRPILTKYDAILFLEIVEHLANPKETIQSLLQNLNKNGLFILSTVNKKRITSKAPSYSDYIFRGRGRIEFSNSAKGSEHVYEFTKKELLEFLRNDIGLDIISVIPTANLVMYPLTNLLNFRTLRSVDSLLQSALTTFGYVVACRVP